ncbi:MAG: 2-ketoisovalerate ferredoxin oxidoreductase subunit delta [Bacteroidetes bacterium ADurb.Bin408]|nr:MAG: 2-ketoisovalerate ferredoxin oxidoreductase subunit delta [Bacteroidetes bacterium ADurb.Bin408]
MKRTVIKINEDLCNGCGLCVSGCHEGALQIIDDKARLISDLFCDGLGACIGECPVGAIELIEREAEPYDEVAVIERISLKGEVTIIAHLNHLYEHNEMTFYEQALKWLESQHIEIDKTKLKSSKKSNMEHEHKHFSGCPGSMARDFRPAVQETGTPVSQSKQASELKQWPVQMHLVNPSASYFQNADVLLAADCVAFAMGNFHSDYLKNRSLAIACPKLDNNKEIYVDKLTAMIEQAKINTLTVMIMEVPCCGGLVQMAQAAVQRASRKVPVKVIEVALDGSIINESWL